MGELMKGLKRTHYCADVNENMIGETVTVMGWVNKRRDLGQLIFIALRDRTGLVQATIDEVKAPNELFKKAETVRGEYVLAIKGTVVARTPENINPNMKTGKVEIEVIELRILSEAEVPPFSIMDEGVANDLRLKHRYLDLRRPELQKTLFTRNEISQTTRNFLTEEGFIEVETPILTKSTPEGARDYLVPSREYPGNFYALPQSPQVFKQLLMVSGFDKYFQITKCFRDEDLRADRQPEFTQIDMELSFVDVDDVINVNEKLLKTIFKKVLNEDIQIPFERIPYKEAMERYGSDKPDTRFGIELVDISEIVTGSEFKVFQSALDLGGSVRCINATGCAGFTRKQIDALSEFVKSYKAKGIAWITLTESGETKTSLTKFFSDEKINDIVNKANGKAGDLILICADKTQIVFDALGALRLEVAKKSGILNGLPHKLLWVTEFPLFEWVEEDNRFYAKHHPFTSPMDEDLSLLESNPAQVRAKAYDIVMDGVELGGGSIRIYQKEVQDKMFELLGFSKEEAYAQFGHLLDAFKYGAPPHGGLAYGLDRIAMLLTGAESIRDVIAFPKVKDASCPMTNAPSAVDQKQLNELGIKVSEVVNCH